MPRGCRNFITGVTSHTLSNFVTCNLRIESESFLPVPVPREVLIVLGRVNRLVHFQDCTFLFNFGISLRCMFTQLPCTESFIQVFERRPTTV